MRASARGANLRALLSGDEEVKKSAAELIEAYELVNSEDTRGTRLANMLNADGAHSSAVSRISGAVPSRYLDDQTCYLLEQALQREYRTGAGTSSAQLTEAGAPIARFSSPRKVWGHSTISIHGVRYATREKFYRDSHVVFSDGEGCKQTALRAGQIEDIFTIKHLTPHHHRSVASTFLVVKEFDDVEAMRERLDSLQGHAKQQEHTFAEEEMTSLRELLGALESIDSRYQKYGPVCGFLCSASRCKTRVILEHAVVSHFARTTISTPVNDGDIFLALPLDRLMRDNATLMGMDWKDDDGADLGEEAGARSHGNASP
ncbi:hypothetical protein DENSPDRAFT_884068 [Dentipellis sp. KUC8613]|nr:hypothetical protein DENSPDRAFT_884068 [Dentipellis sp. KUC8613]